MLPATKDFMSNSNVQYQYLMRRQIPVTIKVKVLRQMVFPTILQYEVGIFGKVLVQNERSGCIISIMCGVYRN